MNVLFLSHRLPYAPNRGDRVRAFHLLHEMARWARVDLVSLVHDDEEAAHAADLKDVARTVTVCRPHRLGNLMKAAFALPSHRPTTHSLLTAPGLGSSIDTLVASRRPDAVFAYCTGIAPLALRPSLLAVPKILDMVDVDSEKWAALATSSSPPASWIYRREARTLSRFEALAAATVSATLVVNDRERRDLLAIAPRARVEVFKNGVDVESLHSPRGPAADPIVVFCGVMDYAPNVEGALWLGREVWPVVKSRFPAARLEIVGAKPTRAVESLTDSALGANVSGSVADVRPHLWQSAVAVAPLHTARGVQNKVLEAVAAGLPVVVTPIVMAGLPTEIKPACVEASTAPDFADRIIAWLALPADARRSIAAAADLANLTWDRRLSGLKALFAEVIGAPAEA